MHTEVALVVILGSALLLLILAQFLRVPYPILLVLGGLALGAVPGVPDVELEPEVVLLVLLPPLLYAAAFFTPLRELRRNVRPIAFLSIGLVLATALAVAIVAHEALGFDWPTAFVLGAIVSPTDPVAATAIARRLGAPRRIVTIVEGESLINDATALVAYKFAVAAVLTGAFSLSEATLEFFLSAGGGVLIGCAIGAVVAALRFRLDNPPVEVTIALFTAYFAYLPAEAVGASGVVAAVTVGIWMGRQTSRLTSPTTRIQGDAVWEIVTFVLNSTLFILVGLQLPGVLDGIEGEASWALVADGALIAGVVMLTRLVFVPIFTYVPRLLFRRIREADPYPPWQYPVIIGWTGMRGAVSLAAALALPLATDAGAGFPHRDLIIFLTFSVILATLVIQGLTLPPLIRLLGVEDDDSAAAREETKARIRTTERAIERVRELAGEDWVRDDTAERVQGMYEYRLRRFTARVRDPDGDGAELDERSTAYQQLLREVLEAQRDVLIQLRGDGKIDDEVLRRIERELDHEDSRLEI